MTQRSADPWILILAGGRGTRFWPASRRLRPKHVLPLLGSEGINLLQATVGRARDITPSERIFIITAEEQESVVAAACKRGKAIFCEKPLAHTATDARAIARLVKTAGVKTKAAELLGLSFRQFRYKLSKHALSDSSRVKVSE